jgi:hypothetical protein
VIERQLDDIASKEQRGAEVKRSLKEPRSRPGGEQVDAAELRRGQDHDRDSDPENHFQIAHRRSHSHFIFPNYCAGIRSIESAAIPTAACDSVQFKN